MAQDEEEAMRHLWGKLGMLLQRGNATILANSVPSFPGPYVDENKDSSCDIFL